MESFNGHVKGENKSLFYDAANIRELQRAVAKQMQYCNGKRGHSALGYTAPINYIIQKEILPQPTFGRAVQST